MSGKCISRNTEAELFISALCVPLKLFLHVFSFQFIAHPYSQVMLNSVVYKGTSGWHQLSFPTKLSLVMLFSIFMPLCMLGYMLTPTNRFTKKLEIPLFKLMSQASSVLWFLVLVTMSAFQDKYDSFLRLSPLSRLIFMFRLFLWLWFSTVVFFETNFLRSVHNMPDNCHTVV